MLEMHSPSLGEQALQAACTAVQACCLARDHAPVLWLCSFMKVGTMVFLCHDVNDVFMELAKMMGYIERKRLSTALFVWFMLTWFFSRMYYFPVYIIRSVWSEPIEVGSHHMDT